MVYTLYMKSVALKALKLKLSELTEEAAKGTTIEVTKYNKPFVYISSATSSSVHMGIDIGKRSLKAATKTSNLDIVKSLNEDRNS